MEIKSLLDQPSKLPTIPKITHQLIRSFSDENVASNDIANQLAADPALSAKLLRLANSAYFNLSRTIGSVDDALRMLGFVMARNLVLGNGMAHAFRNTPGIDLKQFWRYNLYTACASRWLAERSDVNADLVFTVALMHGVGQLHMHVCIPQMMVPLDKKMHVLDSGRAELERNAFGFHHGEVASELAKIWNFPLPIVSALRHVPEPLAAQEFSAAAAFVNLGAWRARSEVLKLAEEEMLASRPLDVCKKLGLGLEETSTLMPALTELTEGLDAMLD